MKLAVYYRHFSKAFNLVPHDRLLTKLASLGVDSRVVVWVRAFLVGRTQRGKAGWQLIKEGKVTSGVPQGNVLGPLLFLVYVNDIWRNINSNNRIFADDCKIYRKITSKNNIEICRWTWTSWAEWVVDNGIKINPRRSKAIRFTRARVKNPLGYFLSDQKIQETSSCKYVEIIL